MTTALASMPTAEEVLNFWLGDATLHGWPTDDRQALWFGGGVALDRQIRDRFGPLVDAALQGDLLEWETPLTSRLALVILLDQFSRNVHRGSARAFAGDGRAQKLVLQTLAIAQDNDLPVAGRVFLYMPLMHAESVALQHECVARFSALIQHSPPDMARHLQGNLAAAQQHLAIIEQFGRFPHRNAALGRTSTPAEEAFLQTGPRFGQ
jgi:uncharacterized protein (DUF924 family)